MGLFLKAVSKCLKHTRSEEHTSELQSRRDLVCRLLLEKKKKLKSLALRCYNLTINLFSRSHNRIAIGRPITINFQTKFYRTSLLQELDGLETLVNNRLG